MVVITNIKQRFLECFNIAINSLSLLEYFYIIINFSGRIVFVQTIWYYTESAEY